jgi:DNA recombination protein RmuC
MGFRTLAVQKRSSEVWKVLGAVKAEFSNFSVHLSKVRKQLDTATGSLDKLQTTRTNQIQRKLKDIQTLDAPDAGEVLELPPDAEEEEADFE